MSQKIVSQRSNDFISKEQKTYGLVAGKAKRYHNTQTCWIRVSCSAKILDEWSSTDSAWRYNVALYVVSVSGGAFLKHCTGDLDLRLPNGCKKQSVVVQCVRCHFENRIRKALGRSGYFWPSHVWEKKKIAHSRRSFAIPTMPCPLPSTWIFQIAMRRREITVWGRNSFSRNRQLVECPDQQTDFRAFYQNSQQAPKAIIWSSNVPSILAKKSDFFCSLL